MMCSFHAVILGCCIRHSIALLWWANSCFQSYISIVTFVPCAHMEKTNIHAIMAYYMVTCVALSSQAVRFSGLKKTFSKKIDFKKWFSASHSLIPLSLHCHSAKLRNVTTSGCQ